MDSSLQLLKDLIAITTGEEAMNLINNRLTGKLKPEEIAHTILEITGRCPMCKQKRQINGRACPSCHDQQLHFLDINNKIKRYRQILKVIPEILSIALNDETLDT